MTAYEPLAPPEPPDQLILRDETGQPWSVTVRPDGQLQTAKLPDGVPVEMQDGWLRAALAEKSIIYALNGVRPAGERRLEGENATPIR